MEDAQTCRSVILICRAASSSRRIDSRRRRFEAVLVSHTQKKGDAGYGVVTSDMLGRALVAILRDTIHLQTIHLQTHHAEPTASSDAPWT